MDLQTLTTQFRGFSRLNAVRQIGLMVGLAASVAIGVAIVLWSQSPSYSLLYGGLNDKDRAAVVGALGQAGIDYKLDPRSGDVTVPADQVYNARIKLATEGLPKGAEGGFDLLQKNQGFGTSQFIEQARYNHMIEEELARSVASLDSVSGARVHLARPKQSIFVRPNDKPTASVLVDLYPGRTLDEAQVAGIVHLVAASVPGLQPDQVTVVDQRGHLLTGREHNAEFGLTADQFKLSRRLEHVYQQRIMDILTPIVGADGVRAQVVADLDFTRVESTKETYNPDKPALRSEQTSERITHEPDTGGVPGALTNQPPPAGTPVAQPASAGSSQGNQSGQQSRPGRPGQVKQKADEKPVSSSRQATRNYELDRTISHIQQTPGGIQRLSVAVVVDDKAVTTPKGEVKHVPRSSQEIARLTSLVKQAVGFNSARGDSVNVVNISFKAPAPLPAVSAPPIWQRPFFRDLIKQLLGALGIALLLFGVLRPVMKSLAHRGTTMATSAGPMTEAAEGEGSRSLPDQGAPPRLASGQDGSERPRSIQYAENLATAKSMAQEDPKRVAQVVKSWLVSDEG